MKPPCNWGMHANLPYDYGLRIWVTFERQDGNFFIGCGKLEKWEVKRTALEVHPCKAIFTQSMRLKVKVYFQHLISVLVPIILKPEGQWRIKDRCSSDGTMMSNFPREPTGPRVLNSSITRLLCLSDRLLLITQTWRVESPDHWQSPIDCQSIGRSSFLDN
jgi:hypothetical protein